MKSLSKNEVGQKTALIGEIRTAHEALEAAINNYNSVMEAEKNKVTEKLDTLNSRIQEAGEWVEGIVSDMSSYYGDKSEKWQEGENGQNYANWMNGYESFDADKVDIDFPEDIEVPDCEVADELENLPDEP
jgi:hypothetical protein